MGTEWNNHWKYIWKQVIKDVTKDKLESCEYATPYRIASSTHAFLATSMGLTIKKVWIFVIVSCFKEVKKSPVGSLYLKVVKVNLR